MTFLLLLSLLAYGWLILRCRSAWNKLAIPELPAGFIPATKVSVILPVRNEARHILRLLQDLERQHYPADLLEVLVVDDHSDDETEALVQSFATSSGLPVRLIRLADHPDGYGKKAAVKQGIAQAQGELLVFTDGDCRVQPEWLRLYAYTYTAQRALFI
ncbi:glycosyltransferase, partial [Pontibacter sp. HJ8]